MLFPSRITGVKEHQVSSERKKKLAVFEKTMGIRFRNIWFLDLAFFHRSFGNELTPPPGSNERLEFLGDSVLGLVVADTLFQRFADKPEGELAKIKSYVVSEGSLAELALQFHVDEYLCIGKGEELSGGRQKKAILADAFEAIIGAVYLDQGFKEARTFVLSCIDPVIDSVIKNNHRLDYKTLLQEYTQKQLKLIPRYTCISREGPDHAKIFTFTVSIGEEVFGPARGASKKEAEQGAAKLAWEAKQPNLESLDNN